MPRLVAMTDEARTGDIFRFAAALPAGSALILRHYHAPERRRLAERLAGVCRRHAIRLLVGADGALAAAVRADGVHFPEFMLSSGAAGRIMDSRPQWIFTAAAHSEKAVKLAERAGVDGVLLSPVFVTKSHPASPPIGVIRFSAIAHRAHVPVYALGGVSGRNATRLRQAGSTGLAGIGFLSHAIG